MTQPTPPQYRSSGSVAKRPTIFIDVNDPRAKKGKLGIIQSRSGAEIEIVNTSAGMSLSALYSDLGVTTGTGPGAIGGDSKQPYTFDQIASTLNADSLIGLGGIGVISNPNAPLAPKNLTASWSGDNLTITFDWDASDPANIYASTFNIMFTPTGDFDENGNQVIENWKPAWSKTNTNSASQSFVYNPSTVGSSIFHERLVNFNTISVTAEDAFGNTSTADTINAPAYSNGLPQPVISVASVNNGYTVSYTPITNSNLDSWEIYEVESSSGTAPTTGYIQVYQGSLNPVTIVSPDLNPRWVYATFVATSDTYSQNSTPVKVTPTSPVTINTTQPTEVSSISASWSGNEIVVNYTMPSSNAGATFIVTLTAPNSQKGYFYFSPQGSSLSQTYTITEADLYSQFGNYYSSYTGVFVSSSNVDVRSNGVSFAVTEKPNTLFAITPSISVGNTVDGYTVQFDFSNSTATSGQVYQFFEDPTSFITGADVPDYMDATYASGGSSGSNTITVSSLTFENGNYSGTPTPLSYFGYQITGIGITGYNWITSITSSGSNYVLTLNSPLTQQASGNYHMQTKVYDGSGPADIFLNYYSPVYVIVAFYDDYGDRSQNSTAKTINAISPVTSIINSAVQISNSGSIYLGGSKTSVPNIIIGTNNSEAGIFVYGPNDTISTPSTQILGATGAPYTFVTTDAQIADWVIKTTSIENDLSAGAGRYTGLSGTGNYAFWAGSQTAGNSDNSAAFSVTPGGAVVANNITINGGSLNVNNNFTVSSSGILNAHGATISGGITATSGSFTGNVSIASGGSLYSGSLSGNTISGAGYILNSSGLQFNSSSSAGVTSINGSTGLLTTTSANIGGWLVNSNQIYKGGSSGGIYLDNSQSSPYIYAQQGVYTAGITPQTQSSSTTDVVIWAGETGSSITGSTIKSSAFQVLGDGTLISTKAQISGTVSASGQSYEITMDPNNQYIGFGPTPSSGNSFVPNGLIYTRGTNIIMEPTSTPTYDANGGLNSYGLITSGSPALILQNPSGSTPNIVMGISLTTAQQASISYVTGSKTYAPPLNQYVSVGPSGVQISAPEYSGHLTQTISAGNGGGGDPFIRTIIYNPSGAQHGTAGNMATGFAVYYINGSVPSSGHTGLIGDIWLEY